MDVDEPAGAPLDRGPLDRDAGPLLDRGLRRVAMVSVHTSPLDQPGTGDAGGMNVYVTELARQLADRGVEVDIFTRATSSRQEPVVPLVDGVTVRHIVAGPFEGLRKEELPAQLCVFAREVLRTEAQYDPGHYDLVHTHYWLSGQVGALARDRWGVPLVHSMHTMGKVKNSLLAEGDTPEPVARIIGEEQVVAAADMLVANTDEEAKDLINSYDADPGRVEVVHPGVDLDAVPARASRLRPALGSVCPPDADVLLFVGRIQPLKAPDVLLRAAAALLRPGAGAPSAPAGGRGRRRAVRQRPGAPHRAGGPRRGAGPGRRGPVRAPGAVATGWSTGSPRPASSACRRTTRASAWSPSRRRRSAPPWSPLPWAGCPPPSPTGAPGCWWPATSPGTGPRRSSRVLDEPGLRDRLARGARRPGGRVQLGAHGGHVRSRSYDRARSMMGGEPPMSPQDVIREVLGRRLRARRAQGRRLPGGPPRASASCRPRAGSRSASTPCSVHAFVCRRPDENFEAVYRWLLERNQKMYAVAFALDPLGDIYLDARLPLSILTPEELDRLLGAVLTYADESFNTLLELGLRHRHPQGVGVAAGPGRVHPQPRGVRGAAAQRGVAAPCSTCSGTAAGPC